jgi:PAS domain-containing protein
MKLRCLHRFGGKLAVIALTIAAGFPPASWARSHKVSIDDGLIDPRRLSFDDERNEDIEEDENAPAASRRKYQIIGLSDGDQGEIYLGAPDSEGLRIEADGSEPLPPVSVDNGHFQFQVTESSESSEAPQPPPPAQRSKANAERRSGRPPRQVPDEKPSDSPAKEAPPRTRPRAQLTGLRVGATDSLLEERRHLTFSFLGIDPAAQSLRYRYRLSGLAPDWIDTSRRSARYLDLRPGPYRFEVKAVNDAGLWSKPVGLSFTVLPLPWWRRHPSLLAGCAAAGIGLLVSLVTVNRTRRLLQFERLRASIAADLHDQVGAGLTDIAILSEVAARKAGNLPELERVAATARELVDGMGDIVWLINPRWDSLSELFLRLKDSYAELFAYGGAQFEVGDLSVFENVRLPMAYRQDLHLLFKEAVRNALRHSGCRQAELSVTLRGRHLEVLLQDDGRGFPPERRNGNGEGLAIMQRRAERLSGRLEIDSSAQGTAVRFVGVIP